MRNHKMKFCDISDYELLWLELEIELAFRWLASR